MDETELKKVVSEMMKHMPVNMKMTRLGHKQQVISQDETERLFYLMLLKSFGKTNSDLGMQSMANKNMNAFLNGIHETYRPSHNGRPIKSLKRYTTKRCKVQNCTKPYHSNGYCTMHLSLYRRGKIDTGEVVQHCLVRGCTVRSMSKGLCSKHYDQVRNRPEKKDDIMAGQILKPRNPRPIKICSIDGCGKKHKAYGFCEAHYTERRRSGEIVANPTYRPRSKVKV